MKITLVVLFLMGLTFYCKCVVVLSLPPSVFPHASSLDESLMSQKPLKATNNKSQQQLLVTEEEEELNEPGLIADLYSSLKDFWRNDPSLSLQKREDIESMAAIQQQQTKATHTKNKQNEIGPQPQDSNNVGLQHFNYNKNKKNENNILKSSKAPFLPLSRSNSATDSNEATNLDLNTQRLLQFPLQTDATTGEYDDTSEWLSSSPEMINDIFVSPPNQKQEPLHLKRKELENMPLVAGKVAAEDSPSLNKFVKSTKYWSAQCPLENGNNCLQEYYGALIADRNNALLKQLQNRENNPFAGYEKSSLNYYNDIKEDDIVLLLTAEQKLMQFLGWALSELDSNGKFSNVTANGEDSYLPGMYKGKKFNLSGRIEPPLLVDEPHYVVVRREYDQDEDNDDNDYKRGLNYGGDPFIPPRGRKHNLPDLDSLLQRYETFVPNRGRRDKIKDIFKYDDLFYPNRGKRQMTTAANDNGDIDERSTNNDIDDIKVNQHYFNNEQNVERHEMQHPLLSNKLLKYMENLMAKMKRKLHQPEQKLENISTTLQQAPPLLKKRLKSMINILQSGKKLHQHHLLNHNNARRQWWKRYMSAKTSSAQSANINDGQMPAIRLPTMATNSLQTTVRSMPSLQQLTQLYQQQQSDLSPPHLRPDNKFLWQQQQKSLKSLAQQFDPLSWHKLQLLLQQQQQLQQYLQRHNQPILTMRHPRLTALQHFPTMQQNQQQLAESQDTQLTYSLNQLNDNSVTNDLDKL